ncbi:MAG: KamA family radical SAM protein [Acidobacteriota bacterium]|jgi:lysine 2,3-aminomutase|nr:KamA family radical SAM protein [Acidobacteriota bacterium]
MEQLTGQLAEQVERVGPRAELQTEAQAEGGSTQPPPTTKMEQWTIDLRNSVTSGEKLAADFGGDAGMAEVIDEVCRNYPMRIPRYYYNLIREVGDPIWRQSVPSVEELMDECAPEDPLREEADSPVPRLTHRYPDRVLLLVTDRCPMYCRYCTRKRLVGRTSTITEKTVTMGIGYIRSHPEIRDVLISGGDPLMVSDRKLEGIIARLREIPHVEVIRIGTRFPCVLPSRITDSLCAMLKKYHPIYVNTHFNHPCELTAQAVEACGRLADAGIPVGCQTVLLKGVNDDPKVLKELMHKLVLARVRPYYLYQADLTRGTNHFRTRVEKGIEIMQALRGHTTGFAVPQFVIDAPGGGGKIPLMPDYVVRFDDKEIILRNFEGKEYVYPQADHRYVKDEGDAEDVELINF